MSIFKVNNQTPMDVKNFGVGSIIELPNESYLLIDLDSGSVGLVNMTTFKYVENSKTLVLDVNFLTEDEAKRLVGRFTDAFSDFNFNAAGIKFKFKGY